MLNHADRSLDARRTTSERFLDRLAADLDRSIRESRIAERRVHADPDSELYARAPRYGGIVRRADVVAWTACNAVDAAAWRLCRAESFLRGDLEQFTDIERARIARGGRRAA